MVEVWYLIVILDAETGYHHLRLQVEEMNCLVSELADISAQERAKLDECEALLASTEAMQVRTMMNNCKFCSEEEKGKRKEKKQFCKFSAQDGLRCMSLAEGKNWKDIAAALCFSNFSFYISSIISSFD